MDFHLILFLMCIISVKLEITATRRNSTILDSIQNDFKIALPKEVSKTDKPGGKKSNVQQGRIKTNNILEISVDLMKTITMLTPDSQQRFINDCVEKRKCTKRYVTGDTLSWMYEQVPERLKLVLWHRLQCDLEPASGDEHECPMDGGWGPWQSWSACSGGCVKSGGRVGWRTRKRECTAPRPRNGGDNCHGPSQKTKSCVPARCTELNHLGGFTNVDNPSQSSALNILHDSVARNAEIDTQCVQKDCTYQQLLDLLLNATANTNNKTQQRTVEKFNKENTDQNKKTNTDHKTILENARSRQIPLEKDNKKEKAKKRKEKNHERVHRKEEDKNEQNITKRESRREDKDIVGNEIINKTSEVMTTTTDIPLAIVKKEINPEITDQLAAVWASLMCLKYSSNCPVVGGWSHWSNWTDCSAQPCGSGQRVRTRQCNSPEPNLAQLQCSGRSVKVRDCSVPCPTLHNKRPMQWSDFGEWSNCSVECGTGVQWRKRICKPKGTEPEEPEDESSEKDNVVMGQLLRDLRQANENNRRLKRNANEMTARPNSRKETDNPQYQQLLEQLSRGTAGLCEGSESELRVCRPKCPRDGGWSAWSPWSQCSVPCGLGRQTRHKVCDSPTARHGGLYCPGTGSEETSCFQQPCLNFLRYIIDMSEDGFILYQPKHTAMSQLIIYIRFRALTDNAVLIHRYNKKNCPPRDTQKQCTSVKLSIDDGVVVTTLNSRGKEAILRAAPAIQLERWHEVSVAVLSNRIEMTVDSHHMSLHANKTLKLANMDMAMMVGCDSNHKRGFAGQISNLAVNYVDYLSSHTIDNNTAHGLVSKPKSEVGVNITEATVDDIYTAIESGDYFTLPCPPNITQQFQVEISLKALSRGVLLFLKGHKNDSYVYATVEDRLRLCVQNSDTRECIKSSEHISLHRWYELQVSISPTIMQLAVNRHDSSMSNRGLSFTFDRANSVFVGGGPPDVLDAINQPNGFRGQIASVTINNNRKQLNDLKPRQWAGSFSASVVSVADHYQEMLFRKGQTARLKCPLSLLNKARSQDAIQWLKLQDLMPTSIEDEDNTEVRLNSSMPDVDGFYACLVSNNESTWLYRAFGVTFIDAYKDSRKMERAEHIGLLMVKILLPITLTVIAGIVVGMKYSHILQQKTTPEKDSLSEHKRDDTETHERTPLLGSNIATHTTNTTGDPMHELTTKKRVSLNEQPEIISAVNTSSNATSDEETTSLSGTSTSLTETSTSLSGTSTSLSGTSTSLTGPTKSILKTSSVTGHTNLVTETVPFFLDEAGGTSASSEVPMELDTTSQSSCNSMSCQPSQTLVDLTALNR